MVNGDNEWNNIVETGCNNQHSTELSSSARADREACVTIQTHDAPAHSACGAFWFADGNCWWRVWAPKSRDVQLVLVRGQEQTSHCMQPEGDGYFTFRTGGVSEGQRYAFQLESGEVRPDPASRWQPDGVHAPSSVWSPDDFEWADHGWRGIARADLVIYELHVGTFTAEGTFAAILSRLDQLRDLGVTAIELMPVAQFPGRKNWGYDGTYWYAVQNTYGGPRELQRFVDACHRAELSVILDVVYNHFGPEGNYLAEFGPYFSDTTPTPWGPCINYDEHGSDGVRAFVLNNVRQWVRDFHIDGFRLDAIQTIHDRSHRHILAEIKDVANEEAAKLHKPVHVIAESNLNNVRQLFRRDGTGYGLDAQWNDDFHHCIHTLVTGENDGYYRDFQQPLAQLEKVVNQVFAYDGNFSEYRKQPHGAPVGIQSGDRFVISIQTHDQIGNRARGERLSHLASFNCLRFSAALMLLSPYIPMLFMGEEYAESNPFPFFCDFTDEKLREAVREGRRREFAQFEWPHKIPDPLAESTFESAKLTWDWLSRSQADCLRQLYRDLLNARRNWPALRDFQHREAHLVTAARGEPVLKIIRGSVECPNEQIEAYFNPGQATVVLSGMSRPRDEILLSTEDLKYGGWKRSLRLSWDLSPFECIVIRRGHEASK